MAIIRRWPAGLKKAADLMLTMSWSQSSFDAGYTELLCESSRSILVKNHRMINLGPLEYSLHLLGYLNCFEKVFDKLIFLFGRVAKNFGLDCQSEVCEES